MMSRGSEVPAAIAEIEREAAAMPAASLVRVCLAGLAGGTAATAGGLRC